MMSNFESKKKPRPRSKSSSRTPSPPPPKKLQYYRDTKVVGINPKSTEVFEYPSKAMRDKYQATGTPLLSGFENSDKDGTNFSMNFILSNGDRSKQRDDCHKTESHMMPAYALNKIRSVTIYYINRCILGFSFFDKDGKRLWKHGDTTDWL